MISNVLSLFDGMSCGQIALNRAGVPYTSYLASEVDKNAMKATAKNYPDTEQLGDVREVDAMFLPQIDLIMGGSPCQSFSFAGKLEGMATTCERQIEDLDTYLQLKSEGFEFVGQSFLFWEYVRLLKELQPKYFLLENVLMAKKWRHVISQALGVEPVEINSNSFSAQNRKRLYWTNIPIAEVPGECDLVIDDILEPNPAEKYNITERFYKKRLGTLAYTKSRSNIRTIYEKSKTLTTGGHGISNSGSTNIMFNKNFIRIPTPMECERLQTVPDGYTDAGLLDSHRYKMLGNGWTIDVIAHIFKGLL